MNTIKDFTADDINLDDATAYHAARGNTAWSEASETEQAQAITRGFDFIRVQPFTPALDIFADGLPDDITRAVYEAALVELETPGSLLKSTRAEDTPQTLKVGSLRIEYGTMDRKDHFRAIETLIEPYIETPSISLKR